MKITKEIFEKYVLAATSSKADVFDSLQDAIATAGNKLESMVLGSSLTLDDLTGNLLLCAEKYICFRSFYEAIPQLDLVLTATGFGIVSNQNLTPASRDRVESLRTTMLQQSDEALDNLILGLIGHEQWSTSSHARLLISSLFFTASQLRDHAGKPDAFRNNLLNLRPLIAEAEEIIRSKISAIMFDHLLECTRKGVYQEYEILVTWSLSKAIGLFINKQPIAFKAELDRVVNLMEDNLERFPMYESSQAYRIKHFERYQNEKDDTTYFFG